MTRLLIVDDDPSVRESVSTVLQVAGGWEVDTAEDGAVALARLSRDDRSVPDLLVLDIMMPRLNGYEVLRWIRDHDELYDLAVIMLTARAGHTDEADGWYDGCDAYLVKPFEPTELVEVVEATLAAAPGLRVSRRRQRLHDLLDLGASPSHMRNTPQSGRP